MSSYKEICNLCLYYINDDVIYEPDKKCINVLLKHNSEIKKIFDYFYKEYNYNQKKHIKCSCGNPYGNNIDCYPKCTGCSEKKIRLLKYMYIIYLCNQYKLKIKKNIFLNAFLKMTNKKQYKIKLYIEFIENLSKYLPYQQHIYILTEMFYFNYIL